MLIDLDPCLVSSLQRVNPTCSLSDNLCALLSYYDTLPKEAQSADPVTTTDDYLHKDEGAPSDTFAPTQLSDYWKKEVASAQAARCRHKAHETSGACWTDKWTGKGLKHLPNLPPPSPTLEALKRQASDLKYAKAVTSGSYRENPEELAWK
jgi:hypothetical protein